MLTLILLLIVAGLIFASERLARYIYATPMEPIRMMKLVHFGGLIDGVMLVTVLLAVSRLLGLVV